MSDGFQDFLRSLLVSGVVGAFVLWFARNWIGSYISEKGKNLATKEDIEEITRKIEGVKSEYAHQTELLKSQLSFFTHTQTFAYEEEFKALKIIWRRLIQLRKSTLHLRPAMDYMPANPDEEKQKRLEQFNADRFQLAKAIEYFKPFYPESIFTELDNLLILCVKEALGYKQGSRGREVEYWEAAETNSQEILKVIERIGKLIRLRIEREYKRVSGFGEVETAVTNVAAEGIVIPPARKDTS